MWSPSWSPVPHPADPDGIFLAELRTHARANAVYAVAAARFGTETITGSPVRHDGETAAVTPDGGIAATGPTITIDIDPARLRAARDRNPTARHLRILKNKESIMGDLIVQARWVVTGTADRHTPVVIDQGAVLSKDGVVKATGTLDEMKKLAPGATVKSYPNHVMLPGFVNSHHHVGLTPLQLGSPDYALELWFAGRMPARKIDLYLDTLYSAFEMIASGVTTVQHIHGWMAGGYGAIHGAASKVLNAYRDLGMRASYCYAVREQNRLVYEADEEFCEKLPKPLGPELLAYLKSQAMPFADFLTLFDQLTEENRGQRLTRIQLAPANLHWCTDDGLLALNEKSRAANVPMHMHLLETAYQKEYAMRRTGKTAVRHLHDLGLLGPRMTLGHGVWLTEEDIDITADTGTCICHNCSSNFRLRSGIAPLNHYEKKGVTVGMGLDEAGINDDRDMLQEMRLALRAHRTPGMDDDVPTCPQVLRMATECRGARRPRSARRSAGSIRAATSMPC